MLSKANRWLIHKFLRWFASEGSVWQTSLAIAAVAVVLTWKQQWDPGYLRFLLVLSLYATFTQNALAYLTERRDRQNEEMLLHQQRMLLNQVDQMELLVAIGRETVASQSAQDSIRTEQFADLARRILAELDADAAEHKHAIEQLLHAIDRHDLRAKEKENPDAEP